MDKTKLVATVAHLFEISGHKVTTSIAINHREIDVIAQELQGLVRKIIVIECADYAKPVGVEKLQRDIDKLKSAKETFKDKAVLMHVSTNGYTPEANGYAESRGIDIYSLQNLLSRLVNFDQYVLHIESDQQREIIEKEYQPNTIHYEGSHKDSKPSISFLKRWLEGDSRWLTVLGDYGVGKSWTLKKLLYELISDYKSNPNTSPLPLFIPLQSFTKAFDFKNLILKTFDTYRLSGVHYDAFAYLMNSGKVVFLLDSFDEMAQHLKQETIRENLKELLSGISENCKAIMTSRPNYFESKSERILVPESDGRNSRHPFDKIEATQQSALSKSLKAQIETTQFARISDLTYEQRKKLFQIVLGANSDAYKKLIGLFHKFSTLDNIAQRAVIARLLTSVAETIVSTEKDTNLTPEALIPQNASDLTQATIYQIVINNLLLRDQGIGSLSHSDRLTFLRNLALILQQRGGDAFAPPATIRKLVERLFEHDLRRTDTPQQLLESYYRICRRHSGLTTEGQFRDTTGQIDIPVDELDTESKVGFSHSSLREYLVADAICDSIENETHYDNFQDIVITDLIGDFIADKVKEDSYAKEKMITAYTTSKLPSYRNMLFKILYRIATKETPNWHQLLGKSPALEDIDISGYNFNGHDLSHASIKNSIILDTDFRNADIRNVSFHGSIIDGAMFDNSLMTGTDFSGSDIESIYAYDKFITNTSSILTGKDARQWLYSSGAIIDKTDDLNPLAGQPWYEAAREVTRTLQSRISGTHQDISLIKGTDIIYRPFAKEFVKFLQTKGIITIVAKSKTGPGNVIKVTKKYWPAIQAFCNNGAIHTDFKSFFEKYLDKDALQRLP
ncbi:NACHT domain-containing protein [Nitratidesulfovibrio termitidis]|uniref:NACHT domain-containing protein n=1 Tax=Nitratidesulfovibrio termitidis TaxID=42252 RepID=UPI000427B619|nr:NACHT domain-containing protein [Nitratidesulfovibrio termitidis]